MCPFKEKIIEELNNARMKEKEIMLNNKMNINADDEPEAMSLAKLVEDARNRARGFGASPAEIKKVTSHEKMESISMTKEFKKVWYFPFRFSPIIELSTGACKTYIVSAVCGGTKVTAKAPKKKLNRISQYPISKVEPSCDKETA